MNRVKVYLTFDVEIWLGAWTDMDARFPRAFERYVYGPTPFGQYAMPMTLQLLNDHGLNGVFFVEPMFSARFGLDPLAELVGLILAARQDIELHLHAEWTNESREPLLDWAPAQKVQHLSHFSLRDQTSLVRWARQRLAEAGAPPARAFRAGSFAFNRDTLRALDANGVYVDSSYNHCCGGPESGIWIDNPNEIPTQPFRVGDVTEFPVTIFRDFPRHYRPLQVTACSLSEMRSVLRGAADRYDESVVIVSHNFEMLDRRDFSRDATVAKRFRGLCEFLARNRDTFETATFPAQRSSPSAAQPSLHAGNIAALAVRYVEQLNRRMRLRSGN